MIGKPEIRCQRVFYSCYRQTQLETIQHPSYIISRVVIFFVFLFSVLPNFREHIFLARTSISALFWTSQHTSTRKWKKKSNYVVWPAPSSKFLQNGPRSKKFGHPWYKPNKRTFNGSSVHVSSFFLELLVFVELATSVLEWISRTSQGMSKLGCSLLTSPAAPR